MSMQCAIHHTDLVCPMCLGAAGGRAGGRAKTARKLKAAARNLEKAQEARRKNPRETIWGLKDCEEYFRNHPGEEAGYAEVVRAAPEAQRESARMCAGPRLSELCRQGKIVRVRLGVYKNSEEAHE